MFLKQEIDDYLNFCIQQKRLDHKTVKAYKIDLLQYENYTTNTNSSLRKETLEAFIRGLHTKYAEKTVKRKIASLKAFSRHLVDYKEYEINLFYKINTKFRESKKLPKTIELYKIKALLNAVYTNKQSNTVGEKNIQLRDIAIIELLLGTGMRVSELCCLKHFSVDLIAGILKIDGKGAKERVLAISNKNLIAALKNYINSFTEKYKSDFFFVNRLGKKLSEQSVRIIIKKYTKLAGISENITPHMFRHSFATLLLEQDVDIRYIQRMLGHSSISVTEIYTYVSSSKQREILLRKNPRNLINI